MRECAGMTLERGQHSTYAASVAEPAPISVVEAAGKLRNGLYLRRIALYDDRITFEVFASRPLGVEELGNLRLADTSGTEYVMTPLQAEIEGRGEIEFTPAPAGLSRLHLSQPGWGLRTYVTV